MRRSSTARAALLAGLVWGALCLAVNAWRVTSVYLPEPWSPTSPLEWRAETPPTGNLRTLLQRAEERLPDGAPVAFSCPQPTSEEEFRCFQWASYWLLPEREVRFVPATETAATEFLVVYDPDGGAPSERRRPGEPVVVTEHGALYRTGGSAPR